MKSVLLAIAIAASTSATANAATILNGSFESGVTPSAALGYSTLGTGNTGITGWTVFGGSIDYIGSYWGASDGNRSVDMDGVSRGSIETTIFDLIVGNTYNLFFAMSGNPDGQPTAKQLDVQLFGATILGNGQFVYNTQQEGTTKANMNWVEKTLQFVANATSATLRFVSANGNRNNQFGAAIDDVRVSAAVVPLPATGLLALVGLAGLALLRRRKEA